MATVGPERAFFIDETRTTVEMSRERPEVLKGSVYRMANPPKCRSDDGNRRIEPTGSVGGDHHPWRNQQRGFPGIGRDGVGPRAEAPGPGGDGPSCRPQGQESTRDDRRGRSQGYLSSSRYSRVQSDRAGLVLAQALVEDGGRPDGIGFRMTSGSLGYKLALKGITHEKSFRQWREPSLPSACSPRVFSLYRYL